MPKFCASVDDELITIMTSLSTKSLSEIGGGCAKLVLPELPGSVKSNRRPSLMKILKNRDVMRFLVSLYRYSPSLFESDILKVSKLSKIMSSHGCLGVSDIRSSVALRDRTKRR